MVKHAASNHIRYTPPASFSGTDSFWYQFADDLGRTNSTKVEVEVTENQQKSVVNFCGNTYETDGTYKGVFYFVQDGRYLSQGSSFFSYTLKAKQTDNSTNLREVDGDVETFIEDRGRLFTITKVFDNAYLSTPYQSKLFVINNKTDEFVELATCE